MTLRRLAGFTAGLGAVAIAGAAIEANAYRVVNHDVTLPPRGKPLQLGVLHLSDTHYQRGQRAKAAFLESLTELRPDMVVFTGDMVADDDGVDEFLDAIAGLLLLPGVFVRGSNDYFAPRRVNPLSYLVGGPRRRLPKLRRLRWQHLTNVLVNAGWHDVDNAIATVELPDLTVMVRGTDDAHIRRDIYIPGGDSGADLLLGVTHAPYRRVLAAMAADGVSLALAGHTHGGQICLPGIGALVTNCDLPPSLAKGLFMWPDADPGASPSQVGLQVHVTGGVGASPGFPLRAFCRPEACLLKIHG